MLSPSALSQSMVVEKHTKTGSFVFSYATQKTSWSANMVSLLKLESLQSEPCEEWEIPCFSEHTKQLIKNNINSSKAKKALIDIRIPSINNSSTHSQQEERWFRYCCEFVNSEDGLCRVGFFQELSHETPNIASNIATENEIGNDPKYHTQIAQALSVDGVGVMDNELQDQRLLEQATIAQKNDMIALDAIAARSRFIANVSHEIRTPMNAIMGTLQILQNFEFNDEIKSVIEMANNSSQELLQTLNNVLDLSKVDARKLDIEQLDINVLQLVENAIAIYAPQLHPNVVLKKDIPSDLHQSRLGDPVRFMQVINNLLSNAVKFTLKGEIVVTVRGEAQNITVAIKDTGVGIAQEDLSLIFEPFRQTDESTTREFLGPGLGLAISRKLSKLMGGKIVVSSKLNEGSEFIFILPMPIILENVVNLGLNKLSDAVPDLSRHHILYAEDNDTNIDIAKQLLRPTKAKVDIATDGKQAIEIYQNVRNITILILDIELPLLNGINVCERIRKKNKSVPIIALTNTVSLDDQKRYFNAGFTHIIEKPIKYDKFFSILARI